MKLKEKVVQSVKWLFIAQLAPQIISPVVTILVIRDFETREMTYVALSQTIIGFFELFSTLGLSTAIVGKAELVKKDLQNVFGLVLLINISLVLLVFGGAGFFSRFYDTPEIANILKVTSLSFLLVAIGYIPGALLVREMRFKVISGIQMVSGLGGAATSYICAKSGMGYWSIVYGGISISVIGTVLRVWFSRTVPWPRLDFDEAVKNLTFGGYAIGISSAWYAFVTMDIVIAGKFWPAEVLGIYAMAVQIVSMPMNKTLTLIKSVALPAYSRSMIQDRSLLETHTIKGIKLSLLLSVPMFWGAAATAALLVPVFLGENWRGVILPLTFLCIAAPFRFLTELLEPAVFVAGRPDQLFKNVASISSVMLIFYFIAVLYSTSPAALAAVWLVVYPLLAMYANQRYCHVLNIRFMAIMKSVSSIITSGVIMLLAVLTLTLSQLGTMNNVLLLSLAVATGVVVYVGTLFVTDRDLLIELLSMVRTRKASASV